jgi:hypothetical protein
LLSQATPDTNQLDRDKLESKLEETLIEIRDLKRQLAQQHLEPRFQVQQELLGEQLISYGLSRRAASRAAREVTPILESELPALVE